MYLRRIVAAVRLSLWSVSLDFLALTLAHLRNVCLRIYLQIVIPICFIFTQYGGVTELMHGSMLGN